MTSPIPRSRRPLGLFVTNKRHVGDTPGGVQTCSREYLALLSSAGIDVDILAVDVDMSLIGRLARVLRTSPYRGAVSRSGLEQLLEKAKRADIVFLNQVNLAGALQRTDFADVRRKTVLLSHGAEVTDLLNFVRVRKMLPLSGRLRPTQMRALHNVLADELAARKEINMAICLSPFDADFERWLGVRNVTWIPRTVMSSPLAWAPVRKRFGFIGTLDHAPNLEGLFDVLRELEATKSDVEMRIVGGPEKLGSWLRRRHQSVTYLGPLDDEQLEAEASTWSAFLNPIFCQARGCSTKLATALAWEIPIITTPVGRRGYIHSEGDILVAENPSRFVEAMNSLADPVRRGIVRSAVRNAARSMPEMEENAKRLRAFLGLRPS